MRYRLLPRKRKNGRKKKYGKEEVPVVRKEEKYIEIK
jgi:hypothetical protein